MENLMLVNKRLNASFFSLGEKGSAATFGYLPTDLA
jgi:hypothetical protein